MNMKWVNGIEKGRTVKTKEKINASDGARDKTKNEENDGGKSKHPWRKYEKPKYLKKKKWHP